MRILFVLEKEKWIIRDCCCLLEKNFLQYSFSYFFVLQNNPVPKLDEFDILYFAPWWLFFESSKPSVLWFTHFYEKRNNRSISDMISFSNKATCGVSTLPGLENTLSCPVFEISSPATLLWKSNKLTLLCHPKMMKDSSIMEGIASQDLFKLMIPNRSKDIQDQYKTVDWVLLPQEDDEQSTLILTEASLFNKRILRGKEELNKVLFDYNSILETLNEMSFQFLNGHNLAFNYCYEKYCIF